METETTTPSPGRWLTLDLEPAVEAGRLARELVTTACRRWHREDLAEPARIAVTELVNNAVVHARTPITVRVALRERELFIAVRDGSSEPPRPRPAAPGSDGGRGLRLLEGVVSRWGCAPQEDGKIVWAVVA